MYQTRNSNLIRRAALLRTIRRFFDELGYIEVETPVWVETPAMEEHIDAIPAGQAKEAGWLRTSPELHMKRLLAQGLERIYQIGPCFRAGERGCLHNPEFTMLEWYEAGGDCWSVLDTTTALLAAVGGPEELTRIRVADAFLEHAGWDPRGEDFDPDRFNLDLVDKVEPALPQTGVVVLCDYPAPLAALASLSAEDPRVAERWELYLDGVELANAYTELTDPEEQRRRFEHWGRARAERGAEVYPLDEAFLAELAHMPPAGGIAIGIDRLAMALFGAKSLDEVRMQDAWGETRTRPNALRKKEGT